MTTTPDGESSEPVRRAQIACHLHPFPRALVGFEGTVLQGTCPPGSSVHVIRAPDHASVLEEEDHPVVLAPTARGIRTGWNPIRVEGSSHSDSEHRAFHRRFPLRQHAIATTAAIGPNDAEFAVLLGRFSGVRFGPSGASVRRSS